MYREDGCRKLVAFMVRRRLRDLRLSRRKHAALRWFECGEFRVWAAAARLPYELIFERIEVICEGEKERPGD